MSDWRQGEAVFVWIIMDLMSPGLNARIARGVQSGGLSLGTADPV